MLQDNSTPWEERLEALLKHDQKVLFELEPVKPSIATILIITDEDRRVHVYVNGKLKMRRWELLTDNGQFINVLESINRELKKRYHIVKVEAYLPFRELRNLYFPNQKIPYIKRVKQYLFK